MRSDFKVPDEYRCFTSSEDLHAIANARAKFITSHREEILEAFIAKYGYEPDQIVQVIQKTDDGEKFFVRLRTQEEMEMISRISSQL